MSRENLFRGRRHDNGEWVYGSLVQMLVDGRIACCICPIEEVGRSEKDVPPMGILFTLNEDIFLVDPATVGQYTGLTDKDGNEIYDGDIMAIKTRISGLYDYRRVQYNDIKGAWTAVTDHICHIWSFLYELNDDYIVIGNIHDNHELLKGGENG